MTPESMSLIRATTRQLANMIDKVPEWWNRQTQPITVGIPFLELVAEHMRQLCDEVERQTELNTALVDGSIASAPTKFIEGGIEVQHWATRLLAESFRKTLGDAGNYVELTLTDETEDSLGYIVTVRRREGKTPHQLRREAEAERDRFRADLNALQAKITHSATLTPVATTAARHAAGVLRGYLNGGVLGTDPELVMGLVSLCEFAEQIPPDGVIEIEKLRVKLVRELVTHAEYCARVDSEREQAIRRIQELEEENEMLWREKT